MRCIFLVALVLAGCGPKASTVDDLNSTEVTLPNGLKIRAETMREQSDLIRGMMFRDSLPADRGMLFYHMREAFQPYYMFNVKIPLDIIWMNHDRQIVEIAHDVPPCPAKAAQECPNYGGKYPSFFVLEVNAGFAAKNGLKEGEKLDF
jgi:uncharacterized protein